MAKLTIKKVIYEGAKYSFRSPDFENGLNIIEGANGSGKSTFFDLLFYSFGGNVKQFDPSGKNKHKQISGDRDNYVETLINIEGTDYSLKRMLCSNDILLSHKDDLEVLPIKRSANNKITFSDWLLSKLQIPSIKHQQGANKFYLNIYDYFRLVYHNQLSDPESIYMPPTNKNFLTDSKEIRRAIFQILIGEFSASYYNKLAELKEKEHQKILAKARVDFHYSLVQENDSDETLNSIFLKNKIEELEKQLEMLTQSRSNAKAVKTNTRSLENIQNFRESLRELELDFRKTKESIKSMVIEKANYIELRRRAALELQQIKKIIATHEHLNLFSATVCPFCLNEIQRKEGHCVCGSVIDEKDYERFFYNHNEYTEILKSKAKSLKTIDDTINSLSIQITKDENYANNLSQKFETISASIEEQLHNIDGSIDTDRIDQIDDKIYEVRNDLASYNFYLRTQLKLEEAEKVKNKIDSEIKKLSGQLAKIQASLTEDLSKKVEQFNHYYNIFMRNTLPECNSAKIDDEDFYPILNDGEYKEKSSGVTKRLNYFLTLLQVSLLNESVLFPKLLLIDTPQTSGIDPEAMKKAIAQIHEISNLSNGQIILSTGLGLYPAKFSPFVKISLDREKKNYLLKRKI